MTCEKLATANDLLELINRTSKAIESIKLWISDSKKESVGGAYGRDKNYNLCISMHTDGSGNRVDLSRYLGNTKLLSVILTELESQLKAYQKDFDLI